MPFSYHGSRDSDPAEPYPDLPQRAFLSVL